MTIAYFQWGGGYIAVTNQSPKGFKGVIFIGRGAKPGGGLSDIIEQGFAANQLLKQKPIPKNQVPDEWVEALGYEQADPEPEEDDEIILLDAEGENLEAFIPVRRNNRTAPDLKSQVLWQWGLIIGLILGLLAIFLGM